jgi:hypothetical protein
MSCLNAPARPLAALLPTEVDEEDPEAVEAAMAVEPPALTESWCAMTDKVRSGAGSSKRLWHGTTNSKVSLAKHLAPPPCWYYPMSSA